MENESIMTEAGAKRVAEEILDDMAEPGVILEDRRHVQESGSFKKKIVNETIDNLVRTLEAKRENVFTLSKMVRGQHRKKYNVQIEILQELKDKLNNFKTRKKP